MDSHRIGLLEGIARGCVRALEKSDENYEGIVLHGGEIIDLEYLKGYLGEQEFILKNNLEVYVKGDYDYLNDMKEGHYSLDIGFLLGKNKK